MRYRLFLLFMLIVSPLGGEETSLQLFRQGEEARIQEDYHRAIELYQQAIQKNPAFVQAYKGLAEAYFSLGQYEVALAGAEKAKSLDPRSTDSHLLYARCLLALGRLEEAERIYRDILSREPQNVEAGMGIAELSLARGQVASALREYERTLRMFPEHKKILTILAFLYEYRGERDKAASYLEEALRLYPSDPEVHLLAASSHLRKEEWDEAEREARRALTLDENAVEASYLLAQVATGKGRFQEALDHLDGFLGARPDSREGWYLKGVVLDRLDRPEESLRAFREVLERYPDDEVARYAMERILLERFPASAPERRTAADYHFTQAGEYAEKFYFQRAYHFLRRGLRLFPYDAEANLEFAELQRRMGFPHKYVDRLEFMVSSGIADQHVEDRLEVARRMLEEDVPSRWGVNPFDLTPPSIGILVGLSSRSTDLHPFSLPYVLAGLRFALGVDERLTVEVEDDHPLSWEEAFGRARGDGADFFLLLDCVETDRVVEWRARLYIGSSGLLKKEFRIRKSGNDRLKESLLRVAEEVSAAVPLYGTIADRRFSSVLLNIGRVHGVEEGMEFLVLDPVTVRLEGVRGGFTWDPKGVLGRVKVEAVSDLVSEGTLTLSSIYDRVNRGDMVVVPPVAEAEEEQPPAPPDPLLYRIFQLFFP
ncbi:Tetratricopeptide TPR_2 repeat-containing protein [Spirochaeta thermophila DSM 6578]|uniref:Tetratricopeptide TPR_2 repeat-containing protein n=1 Tax=Winmispira thermophila (strain ATCC 700085 / DSM 6578 / Z-1203) TaxID=869211 RepID=G0GCY3_WINT7|nr:tetratricopeptide repeat protein [Spirochaeta thermophila]AEJ61275.1 Tetratricopeptide TPR_2 repeat-containing protein [Spirochaeta thermophila DSM 6578]